jgi:hypothetical protein
MRSLPAIQAETTDELSNNGRNLYVNHSIDYARSLVEEHAVYSCQVIKNRTKKLITNHACSMERSIH